MSEGSEDASVSSFEVFDHSNDLILLDNMLERVTDMDDFAFDEPKLGEESPKADSAESLSDLQETQKPSEFGSAHPSIAELETSTHSSSATPLTACEKCPMKEEARALIYWRHPIRSTIVLVSLLVVEFSFLCLSAISLLAYTGIILLLVINGLRLYYQHIAKTENKMFKEFLDREISIPEDRLVDFSRRLTDMLNRQLVLTRDIFLLTNFGASVKFGVILYLMTYVGARFNFLTICIIATLVAFIVPKFYECYQSEIDRGFEFVRKKANTVCNKINEKMKKLPLFGAKKEKAN